MQAGWNLLIHPDFDSIPDRICAFNPEKAKPDIFGSNVAKKMHDIIAGFFNECFGTRMRLVGLNGMSLWLNHGRYNHE